MNNHSRHIIERTYPGVWPNRSITAPCYRDDGAKSFRDYTPLKSLMRNEGTDEFPDVTNPNEQDISR